ncbi:hypothetical protein F5X97DRAFT_329178 [Nemania serpens]|nr:hypothetical protein F5X97DRAFT_329178 [Nemania serpens]
MSHTATGCPSKVDSPQGGEDQPYPDEIANPSHPNGQLSIEDSSSTLSPLAPETSDTEESSEGTIEEEPLSANSIADLPNGANFMVRGNGDRPLIPYKKDHFNGAARPRRMMDDLFDKVEEEDGEKFAEYSRRFKRICRRAHDEVPRPYTRDHFAGVVRPRRMIDDLLDKVKRENPAKFAEYARRHERMCCQAGDSDETDGESDAGDITDEGELSDDERESDGE